ncbi:competence protein ComG [Bacillus luteolus]|uniref:Competence protein ComG n=1 Tax=Litchfieldia luteola TaxID=682179 RepID=A0ABR9QLN3_9BACI|nr:ComZ family protein [Cytobacillus luteolus]MBE4909354.1 competence protein ComG [Cytobacillus luteolus]MBP1940750.1 competence protein ComZ [Cytobacillus luteolus]
MHPKSMEFMQIAMKYLPEAKQMLDDTGIELTMDKLQPMIDMLTKVMADAYELGKQEASSE